MDYRTITDTSSAQYQLQEDAWTDDNGFRRAADGSYLIALGTYYTSEECGKRFSIVLEDGLVLDCLVGDIKADCHTDETNRFREVNEELGCILEFIVDVDKIPKQVRVSGDCSSVFDGRLVAIVESQK